MGGGETNLIKGFEVLVVYFDLGKNEKKYEGAEKILAPSKMKIERPLGLHHGLVL